MAYFDLQKAKAAGLSDQYIQSYLAKRPDLTVSGVQAPATSSNGFDLSSLLPLAGSVVGGIAGTGLGPVGTISGSALGGGAGEFLRQLISGQKTDIGSIGKEAALGGIGGVGGELLGTAFKGARALVGGVGKTAADTAAETLAKTGTNDAATKALLDQQGGNVLERLGTNLRQGVLNPKVNPSPTAAGEKALLMLQQREMGLYGQAAQQEAQSNLLYKKYIGDIQNRLATYNPPVDSSLAKTTVADAIKGVINYDSRIPQWQRLTSNLSKEVGNLKNNQELLKYKLELGSQLSNAFKKVKLGADLSPQEAAKLATWQSIDNIIGQTDSQLKPVTTLMSALHVMSPGIAQSAKRATQLKILGTEIPFSTPVVQGAQDMAGRILQSVGSSPVPGKVAGVASNVAGKTAVQAGTRALFAPQQQPDQQSGQSGPASDFTSGQGNTSPMSDFTGGNDAKVKQAFTLAMLSNPKQAATIKAIYDFGFAPQGTANVGKINAKDYGTIQAGLKNVDELQKLYSEDPSLLLKELVPGKFFSRYFDSVLFDTADTLLRLRTGAQANPTEVRAYMQQIAPSAGDSPSVAKKKIVKLRQDLQSYLSAANNATGDFTASDTASALSQFGQ